MNILIVDDDEDGAALLTMLLERHGWQVHTAGSVAEGRQALRDVPRDVLIADLHLPDGSGTSLLDPRPAHLRGAILVTGAGREESGATPGRERFEYCLTKPINGFEVVQMVRALLASGRAEA